MLTPVIAGFTLACILMVVVVIFMIILTRSSHWSCNSKVNDMSVQVLVLGDIGRSPRMQYHALSIAKHGGRVSLIGYKESPLHPRIAGNPRVLVYPLHLPPPLLKSPWLPFVVSGPLKVLWQIYSLLRVLGFETMPAKWMLVQNPPSIPTLFMAGLICKLRDTRLLVDWHNYGWTILAGARGLSHPFVRMSKFYECLMGRWAPAANLTVTHAMARQLENPPYGILSPILTLHDRPASIFRPVADARARKTFLDKHTVTAQCSSSILDGTTRLVVSSTSWTLDEDFSILLNALVKYASNPSAVPAMAIITGKGPLKTHYEERVKELEREGKLPNVRIITAWLSFEDYAMLLACADLGICLHKSSSGVDLPMKVVDMFGAGLPVAAYSQYESFAELVKEGQNGCGFETAEDLYGVLMRLFVWGSGDNELGRLRKGALEEGALRWDEAWDNVVGRVLGLVS